LSTLILKGLHEFLKEKPFAYLDEMVAFICDEYNVQVHESTMCRILKRAKISRKKVLCPFLAQIALFHVYANFSYKWKPESEVNCFGRSG